MNTVFTSYSGKWSIKLVIYMPDDICANLKSQRQSLSLYTKVLITREMLDIEL
jgi:hypothetical protein